MQLMTLSIKTELLRMQQLVNMDSETVVKISELEILIASINEAHLV